MTNTFIRIQVGAEKYWEEVEGFVRGDKKTIGFLDLQAGLDKRDGGFKIIGYLDNRKEQNPSHPLSKLANELGATLYGGFEGEKDFYLMLPTVEGFKTGDLFVSNTGTLVLLAVNRHGGLYLFYYEDLIQSKICFSDLKNEWLYKFKGNIFQKYARTGIIENDLYKQKYMTHFFK